MRTALLTFVLLWCVAGQGRDPLAATAEYYFARHDYRQALKLWSEVLARDPENAAAAMRVAELKLLFEGREASRDVLVALLRRSGESVTRESRRSLREKLGELQGAFLTEEGQSLFYQGRVKAEGGDCAGALGLVTRALALEQGNVEILRLRARCEKEAENYAAFYESLKQAHLSHPFDGPIQEDLAEAHLHFKNPERVLDLFDRDPEGVRTTRQRIALALALLETGKAERALPLFQRLAEGKGAAPIVLYGLGRSLQTRGLAAEGVPFLQRFLALAEASTPGWDPYRLADRAQEVRRLLARNKPASR